MSGEKWHVYQIGEEAPSRWFWTGEVVRDEKGQHADGGGVCASSPEQAARIVACVNALDGIENPAALRTLLEAAGKLLTVADVPDEVDMDVHIAPGDWGRFSAALRALHETEGDNS